ncbi:cytochrome c oxidase subunit II [Ramlibacter sp. PS4R-6]|uniref:cytochrome c oxidase subunit II n=1 Tax=Ramlibacter sp. PS4R-6 TaxID=3133438 RepID=UPI00309FAD66
MRLLLGAAVTVVMLSLADYAMAATPVDTVHDALHAFGPQAAHFGKLWNIFLFTCTAVFAAILIALVIALRRAPPADESSAADLSNVNRQEPALKRHVTRAVVASALALVALIVASVFTDRAMARLSLVNAVNVEITGHQWWWTVRYIDGPNASDIFTTANEMHIPVGRPVIIQLSADDVIHSLWVPNLAGKKDLIPGRSATLQLRADHPGIYRGQCAEFCGLEHALMGLLVIAEPQDQYDRWVAGQKQPAPEPQDAQAQRGKQVFQSSSCAMCHAIAGADFAGAQRGPDLTHVASRQTLAAGTLKNTREEMAAWIRDPQTHKPGTAMPATPLSQEDLDAVVAYLGGLK